MHWLLSLSLAPPLAALIASVVGDPGWTPVRDWFKYASQKSGAIDVVQGEVRYLRALYKEAGGGDNLAIGWECPNIGLSLEVISTDYTVLEPPAPRIPLRTTSKVRTKGKGKGQGNQRR